MPATLSSHSDFEYKLPGDKEAIKIGRGEDCDLMLSSPYVSRQHAEIICHPDRTYAIQDTSKNGTTVNGQKITRCQLRDGDVIDIGPCSLTFHVSKSTDLSDTVLK